MIGEANECDVQLENIECRALLDTGSTVSTICQQFYESHFPEVPLQSMEDFLKVECAGGQLLPYLGYVEVDVRVLQLGMTSAKSVVLLVVHNTDYNKRVPLLLGTNVLRPLMETCREYKGQHFMQRVAQSTAWWLTFRCLGLEDRALSRTKGRLGLVKSASAKTLRIGSNTSCVVTGFVSDSVSCMRLAMVHPTEKGILPDGVELTPTLLSYSGDTGKVQVEISNHTRRPILIQPRSVLCELQQVDLADGPDVESEGGGSCTGVASQYEGESAEGFKQVEGEFMVLKVMRRS